MGDRRRHSQRGKRRAPTGRTDAEEGSSISGAARVPCGKPACWCGEGGVLALPDHGIDCCENYDRTSSHLPRICLRPPPWLPWEGEARGNGMKCCSETIYITRSAHAMSKSRRSAECRSNNDAFLRNDVLSDRCAGLGVSLRNWRWACGARYVSDCLAQRQGTTSTGDPRVHYARKRELRVRSTMARWKSCWLAELVVRDAVLRLEGVAATLVCRARIPCCVVIV